jgi:uncharacterized membrane protein
MADENRDDREVQEGKLFALIGYLWILCLVPLFLKKDNKFALFHGKQGLVLFMGEIALSIMGIIPILGWAIFFLGSFLFGFLSLIGMVQAILGNYWKMPLVGEIAENIKL